jgi:nicotinate-nucleotide pyrophosphorylase (carboxylating)
MVRPFSQIHWDRALENDLRQIVRLAVREDLDRGSDWTTVALVPEGTTGHAQIVARAEGVAAGLPAVDVIIDEMEIDGRWTQHVQDGARLHRGCVMGELSGTARDLLTAERLLLNVVGHLSGIASFTRRFVDAAAGTGAAIFDTRKTTPGWRRLEKYAVRCGGGMNHRRGLDDAILIKDNHLAFGSQCERHAGYSPAEAVQAARQFAKDMWPDRAGEMIVEVEVDGLDQLQLVLPVGPDIVLLDNMQLGQLREAVALRNRLNPQVTLEASGGVDLPSVRALAETGVDRISVGALTHSAPSLDVGMDWRG